MILISILFVISFALNVILSFKLKKSNANVKELEVKVKVLSDYADGTVKTALTKTKTSKPLKTVVGWTKSEKTAETTENLEAVAVLKKPRKTRRKKKQNNNKD